MIYQEAKTWQTAIGSLLGFVTLLLGALWNFHLNRRRDAAIRREDARAVAAVIYSEILMLRMHVFQIADTAIHLGEVRRKEPYLSLDLTPLHSANRHKPEMFNGLLSKVGLLDPKVLMLIGEFHFALRDTHLGLTLVDFTQKEISLSVVVGPALVAIRASDKVLRVLEKLLKIKSAAEIIPTNMLIQSLRDDYDRGGVPPEAYAYLND